MKLKFDKDVLTFFAAVLILFFVTRSVYSGYRSMSAGTTPKTAAESRSERS